MKKYIYLFYAVCLYISPMSTLGAENITRNDIESGSPSAEQLMTAEQFLDEIETVQKELDELTSTGRLSSSAALAASGVLATLAYGTFSIVRIMYMKEFEFGNNGIKNTFLIGLLSSILPALGVGGLMGCSNYVDKKPPSLSYKDSVKMGFQTLITGLGLDLIFSSILYADDNGYQLTTAFFNQLTHGLTAYRMYVSILQSRQEKQDDIFNLQNRLQDARKQLDKLKHST